MSTVKRVYVEKKPDYAVKAKELHDEIKNYLKGWIINALKGKIKDK